MYFLTLSFGEEEEEDFSPLSLVYSSPLPVCVSLQEGLSLCILFLFMVLEPSEV